MSPEDVVREELAAWSSLNVDEIVKHFSADAVWDNVALGAHHGQREIRTAVEGYLGRMDHAELEVRNLVANGNIVMAERVDRFIYDGHEIATRCMGTFEVSGDKTTAWRDYYDVPSR